MMQFLRFPAQTELQFQLVCRIDAFVQTAAKFNQKNFENNRNSYRASCGARLATRRLRRCLTGSNCSRLPAKQLPLSLELVSTFAILSPIVSAALLIR
jgi:hypothetical protein